MNPKHHSSTEEASVSSDHSEFRLAVDRLIIRPINRPIVCHFLLIERYLRSCWSINKIMSADTSAADTGSISLTCAWQLQSTNLKNYMGTMREISRPKYIVVVFLLQLSSQCLLSVTEGGAQLFHTERTTGRGRGSPGELKLYQLVIPHL